MKTVLIVVLSLFVSACGNASSDKSNQTEFDSFELSDAKLSGLNFNFEIENPVGIAKILFDDSVILNDRIYLIKGTEQSASQFANNLYDFSCGLRSYFLPTHTSILKEKIINGQLKFDLSKPKFGTSYGENYVLERFVFPLEKKGDLVLVCSRHYVKGNKTTIDDLKVALSGYLNVLLVP